MGRGKILKNNKGFTLIELMIAIAIIGILALVLIPKVAGMKDSARAAGLDTNVRIAVSVAEGMVDNYAATDAGALKLEQDLKSKLEANKIENPFTKDKNVIETVATTPADGNAAFAHTDSAAAEATDDTYDSTATPPAYTFAGATDYKGMVFYDAYVDEGVLRVRFIPCGSDGLAMTGKAKATN